MLGYLFLLKSQLCFFLPWFWSACVLYAPVSMRCPLIHGCRFGSQIRPRVLKLLHYSCPWVLPYPLTLTSCVTYKNLWAQHRVRHKPKLLKAILNGPDSTERNTLENTLLPFQTSPSFKIVSVSSSSQSPSRKMQIRSQVVHCYDTMPFLGHSCILASRRRDGKRNGMLREMRRRLFLWNKISSGGHPGSRSIHILFSFQKLKHRLLKQVKWPK